MRRVALGVWVAAGLPAAVAWACGGQTDSDSGSGSEPRGGSEGTASAANSGASATLGSGGSSGAGATNSGGTAGTTAPPASGVAGAAAGGGCPVPGESRGVGFSFTVDPLRPNSSDSTISEGMYPCVIAAFELENDTMVLHLECDQMMNTNEPARVTVGVSADPDPDWDELRASAEVEFRWRVDTHGWRLDRWVMLQERDSGTPLLIAYHTGFEFEPERLNPFRAQVLTDQCEPLQQDCYRAEPQALSLGDDDGNSLTLFPRSTGRLGSHRVWAGPLEARSDSQCTDIPAREYGVLVLLEPPG